MPNAEEICYLTATTLARFIRQRELSAAEVVEAHLERIERVNPQVNAIVTLVPERALEEARAADEKLARGEAVGPLHGLPVVHKDLAPTRGIRTTFGSLVYRDFVPQEDALIVERLKRAGAITLGKSNTPEFGAGSQTFNEVFGATRNPYDLSKTCGGSSGGAAVALACGMVPIADGSDMGGSLRNPAAFCNVVGFRPSPGRVPVWPTLAPWSPLSVEGPMARNVPDAALMLGAIAGPDPRAPLSLSDPGSVFAESLERDLSGVRLAWCRDLGGLPVEPVIAETLEEQLRVFGDLGCVVEEAEPDFSEADEAFKALRAFHFQLAYSELLAEHRHEMKDTVVWNIEEGRRLSVSDLAEAERKRTALYHRMRVFLQGYDFLLLPTTQIVPFDVRAPFPTEVEGVRMETYIDWMKSCYFITITGLPALSLPGGFTPQGLPVGLQIVGRPRDDLGVMQLGRAFERETGFGHQRPDL